MDFKVDLHVHTNRYSQCAEFLNPYSMEEYALKRGLDAVVITDHDMLWHEEELAYLRDACPYLLFFRGIEVSANGCHLVVVGINDAGPLERGSSVRTVTDYAGRFGAAVILAHPYRDSDPDRLECDLVDAIEVASTSFNAEEAEAAVDLASRLQKPMVASSDAHALSRIGWAFTRFPHQPADELELAEMIRAGAGVPVAPEPFPGS